MGYTQQGNFGGLVKGLGFMRPSLRQPIRLHSDDTQNRDGAQEDDPSDICISH
jgi:hypothetical protein